MANAGGNSGDFPEEWDQDSVVKWDEEEHEEQRDDWDGWSGDFEADEMSVHGHALLDGESLELSNACVHEDSTEYDWKHSD